MDFRISVSLFQPTVPYLLQNTSQNGSRWWLICQAYMSFVYSFFIQKTLYILLNIRNRKFWFDGWYLKRAWKSDIDYMSGARLQRNNNSDADEEDLLDKVQPHLSPVNISSPHQGADHPCACIHCHFLGQKRARTLSPGSVRSPDPTISDLYHSKSFTLSPDISQREILSDSSDVAIQSMEKSPTAGGVWAWDTKYIPHQRPQSPWLPSGSLSRLYLKRYTCRSCKHRRKGTVRKRLKPSNHIPCCKDALRKRLHPKYVILRSAEASPHDWEFEPKERIPRMNEEESFYGHCQLLEKQLLTFGDSLVDPRSKSVDVNFGLVISPPPAGRSISAGQYQSKPRHILTPTSEKDATSTSADARLLGFGSPTKVSVDSRSKTPAKYPLNLILPVLNPPIGPTSDQMNRILRRHCHQRVIAFNDIDGLFYPGLVQKCVTPETSVIRFRHNGLFSEVPNMLTLPILDIVHTQALNDGDTALVRVKNLNTNCECWVPARIIGGFLGSPDPSFPLRHRYQLKLFSGSKHVFRRRDVLRISPLFYKGLLDYIRAKRGGDLPDQPAATGEEPAKPKLKLRKRQKPQSAAVSPRSIPRPRPKKVKKENETTPSASKAVSPLPRKLPQSAPPPPPPPPLPPPPPPPPLPRTPSKTSRKLGETSFPRPPQKRPPEKQDKFIAPPKPLQLPNKTSNKPTELSSKAPKIAPQPPPSAAPFKAKPAPPRKQPPPSTAVKEPAEKQPPQPPITSAPASTTKAKPKKPPVKKSKRMELSRQHAPTESVLQESPQVAEEMEGQSIVDTTTATIPVLSEDLHAHATGSLTDGLAEQHIRRSPSEDHSDHGESLSMGQQEPTMLAVGKEWPENEHLELVNQTLKAEQEETVQIQTIQEATSPEAGIHTEFTGLEEVSAYKPGREELSPLIEEQTDTISGVLTGLKAGPEVESAKPKTIPSENRLAESSNAPLDGTLETKQTVVDDGTVLSGEQSILEEPLRVSTEASVIGGVSVLTAETDEGSKQAAAQKLILQSDAVTDKVSEGERLRKQVNDEKIVDVELVRSEPEEQFISERSETVKSKATSGPHLQASEEDLGEMQQKPQQVHTGDALQYQVRDSQPLEITQLTESVGHVSGPSISKTTLKDKSGAPLESPPDAREPPGKTTETNKVSEQPLEDHIPDAVSEKAMISLSPKVSSFKTALEDKAYKKQELRGEERRVSGISVETLPTQKSEDIPGIIPTERKRDERSEVTRTLEEPFIASFSPTPHLLQERKHDEQPSITRKASLDNVLEPQNPSEDVELRKSAEDKIMDGSMLPVTLPKQPTDQHDEQVRTEATDVPEELGAPSTISIESDHSTRASAQERKVDLSKPVTSGISVGEPAAIEQVAEDGRWMKQRMDDGIDETAPLGTSKAAPIEDQREIVVGRGESPQDQSTMASIQERETDLVKPVSSEIPVGEPAAVEQVAEDGRWMKQMMDDGIDETAPLGTSKAAPIEDQREIVVGRGESPQDQSTMASIQERETDLVKPVSSEIPVGEPAAVAQVAEDGRWMKQMMDDGIDETAPLGTSKAAPIEDQREIVVGRGESPQDQSTMASIQERETDLVKPVSSEIPVGEPAAVEQVAEDGRWMKQMMDDGIDETAPFGTLKAAPIEDQREIVVGRGESPQDQSTMASIQERETDLVKPVSSEIPVGEPAAVAQVAEDGRWMKQTLDENISETGSLEALKSEKIDGQRDSENQLAYVKSELIPLPTTLTPSVKELEVSREPLPEKRISDTVIREAEITNVESRSGGAQPMNYDRPETFMVRSDLVGPPLYRTQELSEGEPKHILIDEELLLDSSSPLPSATAAMGRDVEKTETYIPLKDNLGEPSSGEGLHLSEKKQIHGARGIMKVHPHLKLAGPGSDHQLAERKQYESSRIQATSEPIVVTRTEVETEMTIETACKNDRLMTNVRVRVSSPDLLTRDGGASPLSSPSFGATSETEGCEDGEPFGTLSLSVDIQVDVKLGNDGKHYIELQQHGPEEKPFDEDNHGEATEGNVFDTASVRGSSSAGKAQNLQAQTGIVLKTPLKKTSGSRPQSASCIRSSFRTEFSFNQPEGPAIHSARISPLTSVPDYESSPPPIKTRSPDYELDRTVFDKGTTTSHYRVSPKTDEHCATITPTQHISGNELKPTRGPQARGRRGQSARVSARAALLDSGQNYGFVSKISVEIGPLVEDSLIQPDTLKSQPAKENVVNLIALPGSTSEMAPAVSTKVDPIKKPEEPKLVSLKYFTSVDNEPLVTNEMDVIRKKTVQVLTDASVVEEENTNPNTQTADFLVTPREVVVSNEYELELEPTYSEHTSPGPFCSNKYELDTISPIHPDAISSVKAFEAKEYTPIGLSPEAENDESLHVELVRRALAKASMEVQRSVDSEFKDENDHRQSYITSGSDPQAFTDQLVDPSETHGRQVPRTNAADSTLNSLLTSSVIEIVFKTGREGQIELDTVSGINIRTSIEKSHQSLPRQDGYPSGRHRPVSPSSPETTENVRSQQSVTEQRILSPMGKRNSHEIHMQLSTSLDAYAPGPLCKPDKCPQELAMLKSSEIKLSACRCALNKCTCFEHGQSTTPGQGTKIMKLSSVTSQPDKGCILNLAVSVIHADEGELELTTQISTSKKVRSEDGHRDSRNTSPNVRGLGEAHTARNSPQTPTGLANLDDSTVAPKSITFNVSTTTKIDIPKQNMVNCDLFHSNEQHLVISNPDNSELPVPPQWQSNMSPQPLQKHNVTGVKFVQEITQELNANELFHSACPITLENETTIFENSNNSERRKSRTNQLYLPLNQPICPSKSSDEFDGVNHNLVNSTVLRLCNRELGGKVLKTEFETDLGVAGHKKSLDTLVYDVQTKLKSKPCTSCRPEEFSFGNDNCRCWSNNNTELLDSGIWQCFGQRAYADDAASAFQMLNVRQNMHSGHTTNVREYSITSDEQKAVGYLHEHAFFCPSVRFSTALSAWEQSASGVGCQFGRLVEEHSLPVGYGFTEADVASNTPHRSVSQRWEDSRPVCLLVQDELISESESTLRQWNQPCRDSPYSTRTSITKGSHVQGGFYLTNTGITKTHSPLFIAVQKSVIPGVAIQVREWLGTSVTLFPTTNEHPWPEFRIPLETSCPNSGRCRMTSTNSEYGITLLLNSIEQWLLLEDSEVEVSPADMFFLHKHRHSVTFLRTQSQNDKSLRSNPSAQVSEKSQDIEVPAEPIQEKSGASKKSSCHGPRMCSSTALDDGNERMPFYKNLAWNYHQIASTGHLRDSLSECSSDMFQETQLNFKLRYSEPDSEKHWKRHQACKMEAFNFVSILKPSTCLLLEVLCYSVLEETNCESVENLIPLLGSIEPVPTDTQESIDSSASFATSIPQEKDLSRSNSSVDSVLSSSTLPICLRQPTYNTDEHSSYLSSYGCGNSVSGSKTNNELYAPFDDETSSHSTDSYGEKKRSFVSRTDPDMRAHSLDRHMVPAFNYVAEVRKLKSTIHLCDMCLETNCPKSCDPTVTLSSLLTVPTTGRQSRPESQRNGMDFPPKGANSHLIHDYSSQIEPTTKPKQFKIHGNKETLWSSLAVKLCNTTAVPIIVTQSYSFNTVDRSSTCDSLQHSGHKSSEYDETVHKLTEPDEPMQSNPLTIDRYSTHKHDSLPVMALLEITEHCAMSDGMTEVGSREMDKVCWLVSTESRVCMDSNPNTSSSTAGNHPCMSTTPFRCLLSLCYVDLLSAESIRLLEPEGVVVKPQFVEQWTFQVAFELLAAYFDTFFQYPHCALSDYCFKTCLKIRPNFRGPESVDIVSDRNVRKLSNAADCRINAVQSTSKTLAKLASKTSVLPTDQLTCPDFLPSSAQTTRQSLPNDHKTATTTLYKHGDLMGYNYNRTQVHLTRGVEQCTFKAAYPSTADYSRSQPTRLLKLIKTALEAPLRPACALNHYTVQTVQPLLKVYAFSELIGNSFPLCHTGTTQKQSWCTILKSGLNVDSQDSRCLPLKGVAIPHLPTVRRLSLPLTIINSMELVFSVPLTVKPFKKLKAHRSIPRTSIALTCLIKTAYLTKKVSLENTSYDRARTMTDTSHQTMDLTTASELSNGHQRPCSVPESFSTLTRSDISKTFQTSIPEAEGLEGFSENSYTGEVSINSNRLSNVLPSSDRNNKRTPLAKGKVKQHAPTSVTSVVSKVEKPNSYGKSMENLVKGDRRRQWSIPPVKQMVKTIYAGGKQMLKPGKTGKQTRKADPFTGSLLPVAGDVGADTMEKPVKSSPVSHHSSGNSKSFMHRAGRHMSRKQRSSSSSSTASRLFQTLNDADSRKTEPPGTSPYTKSRIPIPVQHPISMMNGCWNRLSLFQTARNQTNAPVLVHGSDSTCEHRIQCDRKISSILYSSATSSCSHTPASALSSYAIKRKCFTNLGKTQKRETAKALNTSDTRSRSALKQVSLNRFPSVSSRIPKLIGDDPNSAGNKHSVFARIRTGISADHHKACDINHICMATPLKKTAGRSMVTPKREKKFKTSRNN